MNSAKKRNAAKPHVDRKAKGENLVVRVDESQKERIRSLAAAQEQTMSNFVRDVVLKLSRGWKLVPPD